MDLDQPVVYEYIDSPEKLRAMADRLSKASRIAADLEADSLYHFQEKVCLLQIATEDESFVVDPLAVSDLSPLAPIFADPKIQKIFHGADYDVRSLYRDYGIEINNLFDTELASRFLGVVGTGLEAVVRTHLGIQLDKRFQKKDWSQRPLPQEMIDYAAGDVLYLLPISQTLMGELDAKDRLSWVTEECDCLSRVRSPQDEGAPLFLKFKGAGKLPRRTLAVLEAILQFRQEAARKKDRPSFKVLGSQSILDLALQAPESFPALQNAGILSSHQVSMYGKTILAAIQEALAVPEKDLPVYPKVRNGYPPPLTAERAKALQDWRNQKAEVLQMDAGLICNRNLAAKLAALNPKELDALHDVEEMKNWQRIAFGEEMLKVLATQ